MTPEEKKQLKENLIKMFEAHKSGDRTLAPHAKHQKQDAIPLISVAFLLFKLHGSADLRGLHDVLNELAAENMLVLSFDEKTAKAVKFMNAITGHEEGAKLKDIRDKIVETPLTPDEEFVHSFVTLL